MNDIVTAISTVGFPIVCTLLMMYLLVKENESHKEETSSLKDSINANTVIMSELKQLISDLLKGNGNDETRN